MNDKYRFDDISFDDVSEEQYNGCLTEADFYPPSDNRVLKSNVKNIVGGDNFADYCKEMLELLEEEEYYN